MLFRFIYKYYQSTLFILDNVPKLWKIYLKEHDSASIRLLTRNLKRDRARKYIYLTYAAIYTYFIIVYKMM